MDTINNLTRGAGIGFAMALILMLVIGNSLILWLAHKSWRHGDVVWEVREDTPDSHQKKQGTPSMGGIGIALCVALTLISAILMQSVIIAKSWNYGASVTTSALAIFLVMQLPLPFIYFSHAILGFADDWSKASGRGGLRARAKFAAQILLAAAFIVIVMMIAKVPSLGPYEEDIYRHFTDSITANWWWAFPLAIIVIVAIGNAVNLTDGLDGLATGIAVQSLFALTLIAPTWTTQYMLLAVAGACLGFLLFNRHPARIFMGDTGSLALGALIGGAAILLGGLFLLPFVAFIFIVEMLSVVAQVMWFKYTKRKTGEGKRLFKRAPLHHHFEMSGWSEWRVVLTFWGINLITTIIGLWLWSSGILPKL